MTALNDVALVTGSTSGIGEGIAGRLASEGMTVIINSHSSGKRGAAIAREIGGDYLAADLADGDQSRAMVEEVIGRRGLSRTPTCKPPIARCGAKSSRPPCSAPGICPSPPSIT